jgi:hypothetical protein
VPSVSLRRSDSVRSDILGFIECEIWGLKLSAELTEFDFFNNFGEKSRFLSGARSLSN